MGAALFLCPAENCGKREDGKKGGRKGERWKNGKEKGKKICRIGKFSPPLGTVKRKMTTRNEEMDWNRFPSGMDGKLPVRPGKTVEP